MDYKNREDFIKLYLGEDMTPAEMATCLGVSESTISYWRNKHNIFPKGNGKTHRQFIREVYDLVKCEYSILGYYKNNRTHIKIKHNKCGHIWEQVPSSFLRGHRCPECMREVGVAKRRKTNEEFKQEVYDLVGDKYTFLEKYKTDGNMLCKHNVPECGHKWKVNPHSFLNRESGCPKCNGGILKTHREYIKEIYELYKCEYSVLSYYNKARDNVLMKHNKCGNVFETNASAFVNGYRKCPECSFEQRILNSRKTYKEFKEDLKKINNDKYNFLGEYVNRQTYIRTECRKCGCIWFPRPSHLLNGHGCPRCAKVKRKTTEEFKIEIKELYGDEYILMDKYNGCKENVTLKHSECGKEFTITPDNFIQGGSCTHCKSSKGEEKISKYLLKRKIKYNMEYTFADCVSDLGRLLRFDFAIFDNQDNLFCLIEYDGIFHYEIIKGMTTEKRLKEQQKNDKIKNQYCEKNNIPLLRIPYWNFDNINEILDKYFENFKHYEFNLKEVK
ncbi:MAG: DUF2726 domain-containing protein [Candidatus Woesearchaeota archaeon]